LIQIKDLFMRLQAVDIGTSVEAIERRNALGETLMGVLILRISYG
jgi:hypothetical protein